MITSTKKERKEIGERFKRFRLKHGLTQDQFGKLIEIHRTEVSWIENGKRMPYSSTIERFEILNKRMKAGRKLKREAQKARA